MLGREQICTKYVSLLRTAAIGLLCDLSQKFQLSPPGVSTRVTTREHPTAEGGTVGEKCPGILPKCRLLRYIQGSFTCRKGTKWDRQLYFPSEGRRAEDFFALKIRRFRPGVNPRTWVPKTSTLPLDHQSRLCTTCFWLESLKQRNRLGDKGVGRKIIIKCTLKKRNGSAWSG